MSATPNTEKARVTSNPIWSKNPATWFWIGFGLLLVARLLVLDRFTTHVDDILPLTEAIRMKTDVYSPWEVIKLSRNYTYAPAQFIFSLPLAFTLSHDWMGLLFWSRFVSLLIWAAGVTAGFRVLQALLGPEKRSLALLGGILMILSLRGTAESSQGYNYATSLLMVVGLSGLFATDQGLGYLRRSWLATLPVGLLFAGSVWTSYQAVFVACGFFLALGLYALWQHDLRLLAKGILLGLFLSAGLLAVYKIVIIYILGFAQKVPNWPNITLPGSTPGQLLSYPFRAWWAAAQNNLTSVPWGWPSQIFTAVVIGAGLYGTALGLYRDRFSPAIKRALLWVACTLAALTVLGMLKEYTLGETRHAFILHFPFVVLITLGLSYWNWNPRALLWTAGLLVVIGTASLNHYLTISARQADLAWIERELTANPSAVITDFPGDVSWDFLLFAYPDRHQLDRMRQWLFLPHSEEIPDKAWAELFKDHAIVYVYSHRIKLQPQHLEKISRFAQVKVLRLAEIDPISSAEISGLINAGNGFYFYKFERL